jgi:predicted GNAT family acetyltransferase
LSDFIIEREVTGHKGRYVIRKDGAEAELTYSITTPTLVIADHTLVPDAFRGNGWSPMPGPRGSRSCRSAPS